MKILKSIITLSLLSINSIVFSQNENTTATVNVDPNIKLLLDTRFSENNNSNYKIQLYYGSLDKAHSVLSKFNSKHSQWSGKIEYETPNYKVWVGNYQTRIEADKAMIEISKNFPSAFIFKP